MRVRAQIAAAMFVTVLAALPLAAQAPKPAGPTLEVRVRSFNDQLDQFEYFAVLVGKEDMVKPIRDLVKALSNDKEGLEGFDPRKPAGLYAVLTPDVADSPVVLMLPIADEARFQRSLKERIGAEPEKVEGGYKVHLPLLPVPLHFCFSNGYLYAALRMADLAPKSLPNPKQYFAVDDGSILSAVFRLDRVPEDAKRLAFGQFELRLNDERKKQATSETPAQKKFKGLLLDGMLAAIKCLSEDGKEIAFRFVTNVKSDDISAELTLTGKPGTALAATIANAGKKKSLPRVLVNQATPTARIAVNVAIPDEYQKRYAAAVDELLRETVQKTKENEREPLRRVFDVLGPTLKAGSLDAGVVLVEAGTADKHALLATVQVKNGKEITQLIKDFSAFVPVKAATFQFEAENIRGFAVHKIELKQAPDDFAKMFATRNLWLATSADTIALSIEEDGSVLKKALQAEASASPCVAIDLGMARLLPLTERGLKPDEIQALLHDAFGGESPTGRDTIKLTVQGGDRLSIKLTAKGKVLRLGVMADELKKK